jgi:hypothetical protein
MSAHQIAAMTRALDGAGLIWLWLIALMSLSRQDRRAPFDMSAIVCLTD